MYSGYSFPYFRDTENPGYGYGPYRNNYGYGYGNSSTRDRIIDNERMRHNNKYSWGGSYGFG